MYDAIGVEVGEGQGYIATKIHLDVEGEWLFRLFQESGNRGSSIYIVLYLWLGSGNC